MGSRFEVWIILVHWEFSVRAAALGRGLSVRIGFYNMSFVKCRIHEMSGKALRLAVLQPPEI